MLYQLSYSCLDRLPEKLRRSEDLAVWEPAFKVH
jgi:hypothetical protein